MLMILSRDAISFGHFCVFGMSLSSDGWMNHFQHCCSNERGGLLHSLSDFVAASRRKRSTNAPFWHMRHPPRLTLPKSRSKPERLLNVSCDVATAAVRCEAEIWQKGLTADLRCVCTTEKTGRCPERQLSSSCPFDFALAAKVRNPPFTATCVPCSIQKNGLKPDFSCVLHERPLCQRQSKSEPKGSAKCCRFWVWSIAA
jgi:hypothetical protein